MYLNFVTSEPYEVFNAKSFPNYGILPLMRCHQGFQNLLVVNNRWHQVALK